MRETPSLHIVVIDRSVTDAEALADTVRHMGIVVTVKRFDNVNEFRDTPITEPYDLIFAHQPTIGIAINQLMSLDPFRKTPTIVILNQYQRDVASRLICDGAHDVVSHDEINLIKNSVQHLVDRKKQYASMLICREELIYTHARFDWMAQNISHAIAYLHDGIIVYANAEFNRLFGLITIGENSILDFIEESDKRLLKQLLAKTDDTLEPQTLRWKTTNIASQNIIFKHGFFQNEPCVQLLFLPVQQPAATTNTPVIHPITSESFFDELICRMNTPTKRQIHGWLAILEIDQYQTYKRRAGLSVTERTMNQIHAFMQGKLTAQHRLAHMGQESFILFIDSEDKQTALAHVENLIEAVRQQAFTLGRQAISINISAGIAALFGAEESLDSILAAAEMACNMAQKSGHNKLYVYDPVKDAHLVAAQEQNWLRRIDEAITYNVFRLVYQPIASLHAVDGERYEVLLRLREKDKDINPQRFMQAAQQTPLATKIDQWVISRVSDQITDLATNNQHPVFFVKLADATIVDDQFLNWLDRSNKLTKELRGSIIFEIAQNIALATEHKARNFVRSLADIGYRSALEHFTGSDIALDLVAGLDVDYVKIDGGLVNYLGRDKKSQGLIHKIVQYAQKNGKKTIAANVQDAESLAVLWREGVNFVQGYYLQKPSVELSFDFSAYQ